MGKVAIWGELFRFVSPFAYSTCHPPATRRPWLKNVDLSGMFVGISPSCWMGTVGDLGNIILLIWGFISGALGGERLRVGSLENGSGLLGVVTIVFFFAFLRAEEY